MPICHSSYRRASDTLDYITSIKQDMSHLLRTRTGPLCSGIHLPEQEIALTIAYLDEVIDDLYREHIRQAARMVQAWKQEE